MVHDLDLMCLMALMLEELTQHPNTYPRIEKEILQWRDHLPTTGPGTIDLHLHNLVESPDHTREFLSLISGTERIIDSFGGKIPARTITDNISVPGIDWPDYPSRLPARTAQLLRKMVEKHTTTP